MEAPGSDPAFGAGSAEVGPVAGSHRSFGQVLKDIGLFFAAPFVTLAYVALFPIIGFVTLRQAMRQRKRSD